jgi:septal ring factor EnvC (AmiA/AmiB activator)
MFTWIGNHWKLLALGLAVLLIAYGVWSRTDKTLFDMLARQYQQVESKVVADLQKEKAQLKQEKATIQNQLTQVQKDRIALQAKYTDIERRYHELQDKFSKIVVPTDIDELIADLRKRGYGSATRAPRPSGK